MRLAASFFCVGLALAGGTITTTPAEAQGRVFRDLDDLDDDRRQLQRDQNRLRRDFQREGGCGPACQRDLRDIQEDRRAIRGDQRRLNRDLMDLFD